MATKFMQVKHYHGDLQSQRTTNRHLKNAASLKWEFCTQLEMAGLHQSNEMDMRRARAK